MAAKPEIPWEKLYAYILSCGNVHELYSFSVAVVTGLKEFCDFDRSLVYFIDGNGEIVDQYLQGISDKWSNMYLEYYSKLMPVEYGRLKNIREATAKFTINRRNWENEMPSEFIRDYIRPQGLKYSLGFTLFDVNGAPRTLFALDRIKGEQFTDRELAIVSTAVPLLNNLHKNLYCTPPRHLSGVRSVRNETLLTERETQIVDLLCQGFTTTNISNTLHIAPSTTRKHIEHIYEKMHVSTRQELLVRLLK